jgi:hypothetical protein
MDLISPCLPNPGQDHKDFTHESFAPLGQKKIICAIYYQPIAPLGLLMVYKVISLLAYLFRGLNVFSRS